MPKIQRQMLFFLSALIALTVIAVIWANISGSPEDRTNFAKWGLGAVVTEVVALFVFITRGIFKSRIYTITLAPPKDMEGFDVSRIVWKRDECIGFCAGEKFKISPVLGPVGASFEVRLPPEIINKITDNDPIELQLVDRMGHHWEVRPFYIFQQSIALSYQDKREDIISSYGSGR